MEERNHFVIIFGAHEEGNAARTDLPAHESLQAFTESRCKRMAKCTPCSTSTSLATATANWLATTAGTASDGFAFWVYAFDDATSARDWLDLRVVKDFVEGRVVICHAPSSVFQA
jgi:hypothetical protein